MRPWQKLRASNPTCGGLDMLQSLFKDAKATMPCGFTRAAAHEASGPRAPQVDQLRAVFVTCGQHSRNAAK